MEERFIHGRLSDEDETNILDRARLKREGKPIPARLMTDLELESARHQKKEDPKKENDIFDSKGRDVFDEDGLSIDYDD